MKLRLLSLTALAMFSISATAAENTVAENSLDLEEPVSRKKPVKKTKRSQAQPPSRQVKATPRSAPRTAQRPSGNAPPPMRVQSGPIDRDASSRSIYRPAPRTSSTKTSRPVTIPSAGLRDQPTRPTANTPRQSPPARSARPSVDKTKQSPPALSGRPNVNTPRQSPPARPARPSVDRTKQSPPALSGRPNVNTPRQSPPARSTRPSANTPRPSPTTTRKPQDSGRREHNAAQSAQAQRDVARRQHNSAQSQRDEARRQYNAAQAQREATRQRAQADAARRRAATDAARHRAATNAARQSSLARQRAADAERRRRQVQYERRRQAEQARNRAAAERRRQHALAVRRSNARNAHRSHHSYHYSHERPVHWYHGVFIYGPYPQHHSDHVVYHEVTTNQSQDTVISEQAAPAPLPYRRVDRDNAVSIGLRTGSYMSGYEGGGEFSDFGMGVAARFRPVEALGVEVAYSYHDDTFDSDSERVTGLFQPSLQVFAFPWSRLSPYASLGLTWTERSYEDTWQNGMDEELAVVQDQSFGPHIGGGVEISIGRNASIDFETRAVGFLDAQEDGTLPGAVQATFGANFYF